MVMAQMVMEAPPERGCRFRRRVGRWAVGIGSGSVAAVVVV